MNIKTVKELVEILKDTDIVELEWTPERVHIVRGSAPHPHAAPVVSVELPVEEQPRENPTVTVTSPLVGTFYRAPATESEPYVKVGDRVAKDQCLCVVEAMKLMNEIESHMDGVVSAILKQDGEKVGYGDPLFIIEEV